MLLSISDDGVMMLTSLAILRGKALLPRPPPLEGPPVCLQRMSDAQARSLLPCTTHTLRAHSDVL